MWIGVARSSRSRLSSEQWSSWKWEMKTASKRSRRIFSRSKRTGGKAWQLRLNGFSKIVSKAMVVPSHSKT